MAALIQYKNNVAGLKVMLESMLCRIGRGETNDIVIEDELISREHALIEAVMAADESKYILRDLDSTNGTFVNHVRISEHLLNEGDMIRLGQTFFRFTRQEGGRPNETKVIKQTIIPGLYYTTEKKGDKKGG